MKNTQDKMKLMQELKEAGLGKQTACAVMEKLESGDMESAMALLDAHREKLLTRFHKSQECIDCVDYLVYQLQKKSNDH